MNESRKLRQARKLVIERLQKVAMGQPVGRPQRDGRRQPWQKLGKHNGTRYFEMRCEGCGRNHYFQLRKEHGAWSWRPYSPYGRRKLVETKSLAEELITQRLKSLNKSKLEELLDEYTYDEPDEDRSAESDNS